MKMRTIFHKNNIYPIYGVKFKFLFPDFTTWINEGMPNIGEELFNKTYWIYGNFLFNENAEDEIKGQVYLTFSNEFSKYKIIKDLLNNDIANLMSDIESTTGASYNPKNVKVENFENDSDKFLALFNKVENSKRDNFYKIYQKIISDYKTAEYSFINNVRNVFNMSNEYNVKNYLNEEDNNE